MRSFCCSKAVSQVAKLLWTQFLNFFILGGLESWDSWAFLVEMILRNLPGCRIERFGYSHETDEAQSR